MSAQGDAPAAAQSSVTPKAWLPSVAHYGQRAFVVGAFLHLACQAYRAASDGPVPSAGPDAGRPVVLAMLALFWLPFTVFAIGRLRVGAARTMIAGARDTERALAVAEFIALIVIALFTIAHVAEVVWPLLRGARLASDVRPELRASLSATTNGMPLTAGGYALAVAATAFYAARQLFHVWRGSRRRARIVAVVGGVVGYLLGIYAVIRVASGPILPF